MLGHDCQCIACESERGAQQTGGRWIALSALALSSATHQLPADEVLQKAAEPLHHSRQFFIAGFFICCGLSVRFDCHANQAHCPLSLPPLGLERYCGHCSIPQESCLPSRESTPFHHGKLLPAGCSKGHARHIIRVIYRSGALRRATAEIFEP